MAHKNHYKKIFVIAAALFVLFAPVGITMGGRANGLVAAPTSISLTSPLYSSFRLSFNVNLAEATATDTPSVVNWFTSPVTSAVYYVSLTVDKIMTLAVVAGAFFVRLGLQFNDNIFNSPEVQTGFSVSLAIANLGFVLGIIIIAIATIIRNQTYGIKQLLWKLVFMAILVNFGLVIMAPIVGFADSMSNYFINATSPSSATGGYESYVTTMAQAFAPQTMTPADSVPSASCSSAAAGTGTAALCNLQNGMGVQAGSPNSLTQEILAMVFGIAFLALTAFTFFCLAILLIIRYLMLGGLLIVLPLAWLTYVFPKFDNSFSKWWNTFVKWTFFPPLALFFIYLAFTTAANTGGLATQNAYLKQAAGLPLNATQGPEGALVYQTNLGGPIQQAADEVLLVGLTVMGLIFASSLAGKAGSTAVNIGAAGSKAVGGYVGKQIKKGTRAGFNAVHGRDLVKNMRTGDIVPQRLKNIPLVGWVAQKATGAAGRALEPTLNNREYVEAAKKRVPKNPEEIKENLRNAGLPMEDKFAHLASLIDSKDLDSKVMVGSKSAADFLDSHEADIKNYAFEKPRNDVNKALGSDKPMRDAAKKLSAAAAGTAAAATAMSELDGATKTFVEKLKKSDVSKMDSNDALGQDNQLSNALARGFFNHAPSLVSSAFPNMKGPALKNFEKLYTKAAADERSKATGNPARIAEIDDRLDKFRQSLANNALFPAFDPSHTPPPTPTP